MDKLRVFLADDHAIVREGMKRLIDAMPDMEVVGEASDGAVALEAIPAARPHVVVFDLTMPTLSGAEATRRLRQIAPEIKIIALTVHEDKSYLRELLEVGASGYVLKRAAPDELINALRTVSTGGTFIDPRMTAKLVATLLTPRRGPVKKSDDLSERETEVLQHVAHGYTNKEIATALRVSVKSVETYKARAMEKLDLRSRIDIVRIAKERGWLQKSPR